MRLNAVESCGILFEGLNCPFQRYCYNELTDISRRWDCHLTTGWPVGIQRISNQKTIFGRSRNGYDYIERVLKENKTEDKFRDFLKYTDRGCPWKVSSLKISSPGCSAWEHNHDRRNLGILIGCSGNAMAAMSPLSHPRTRHGCGASLARSTYLILI